MTTVASFSTNKFEAGRPQPIPPRSPASNSRPLCQTIRSRLRQRRMKPYFEALVEIDIATSADSCEFCKTFALCRSSSSFSFSLLFFVFIFLSSLKNAIFLSLPRFKFAVFSVPMFVFSYPALSYLIFKQTTMRRIPDRADSVAACCPSTRRTRRCFALCQEEVLAGNVSFILVFRSVH